MTSKAKPVYKVRAGGVSVAVWKNNSDKGPFYSVTTSRSYKQGQEWKETDTYGFDDLMSLAKLLDLAHTWILMQQTQRKAA